MLRSIKDLRGATIHAVDGEIGQVDQFLFDDERWTIRYMVVNTGNWLTGRLVLISPIAIKKVDWNAQATDVDLTRQKVQDSPDITTDQPVSRQMEEKFSRYYGYLPYWGGTGLWGAGMYPAYGYMSMTLPSPVPSTTMEDQLTPEENRGDQHLRSTNEVIGYYIRAHDGEIGHVEDFILDDETWTIRYMVVNTSNRWFGKHILVSSEWITSVSWSDSTVEVDLLRETIKNGPEYDSSMLNRDYEARLYQHYGRPGYWDERPA